MRICPGRNLFGLARRHLARIAIIVVAAAGMGVAAAQPALAFPQQCSFIPVSYNGVVAGGYSRCLSGTGQHRAIVLCSWGWIYGPWTNTGTSYFRESWAQCDDWLGQYYQAYRWDYEARTP